MQSKRQHYLHECFSTFHWKLNLLQTFALVMETYAKIKVSTLLQLHRTAVLNFVPGNFGLFQQYPWQPLAATWSSAEPRLKTVIYRTERVLSKPQSTGGQNNFYYFLDLPRWGWLDLVPSLSYPFPSLLCWSTLSLFGWTQYSYIHKHICKTLELTGKHDKHLLPITANYN